MENKKERREPFEIYHVRNVIGRKNLITYGRTNELAHALLHSVVKVLSGWHNGTRQHYVALPGSTASYGERTQTCTFENHGNLHAYLTNWPLTGAVHSGGWLLKRYKMARRPFSKLCSNLLCIYCSNKQPEWGPTKAQLRVLLIMPLWAWAHWRSAYAQLSPLYLLSTLMSLMW